MNFEDYKALQKELGLKTTKEAEMSVFKEVLEKRKADADPVNSPKHYTQGPIEVIDLIEGFDLNYHLGNVVKYILRAPHKGRPIEDLKKARWYLDREITRREKNNGAASV